MAVELKLPELGENIESADVLNVLVKQGDHIEKDQPVIEIETDKATIEVPSTVSGNVNEVLIKAGEKIKVGQTILNIQEGDGQSGNKEAKADAAVKETKAETKQEKKPEESKAGESKVEENKTEENKTEEKSKTEKAAEQAPPKTDGQKELIELKLPELGENIDSASVINVLVKEGDDITVDQALLEIETDKATIEVPSTVAGKVTEVLIKAGDKAKVGETLVKVESSAVRQEEKKEAKADKEQKTEKEQKAEPVKIDAEKKEEEAPTQVQRDGKKEAILPGELDEQPPIIKGAAPAAPSVRRIARELGVDINKVPGTGKDHRISMEDVKAFVKKINEQRETGGLYFKTEPLPDFSKFGAVERKEMSNIRTKTAEHLSSAWSAIPHVTQHDKADITELEKLRKELNPKIEKEGGKLTVTAILLKIVSAGMKLYPQFNTSVDMEKKEIIYKKYYNIGVAVDTPFGLIVPVIKNVDAKTLTELSVELNNQAEKARNKKLSLEEMQGGCFTITNLGGIGGTYFTPIVNLPETAILGVSRGNYEPVYINNTFQPRLMLPLSLSYDHRVIDGADAARFLRWICEALEQPLRILI